MAKNQFTFTIEPKGRGKRHVSFGDLIAELQTYHAVLERTDRMISDRQTAVYDVVALSHSSPVRVVLEERPINRKSGVATSVIPHVVEGLAMIHDQGIQPEYFDRPILEKVKALSSGARKRGVVTRVAVNGRMLTFGKAFERKIDKLLQDERNYLSSIEGRLDAINVHNDVNVFYIYPNIGAKKIRCHVPKGKREEAIAALTKWVSVRGQIFVHANERFPHRIEVSHLQVVRDDETYPGFHDILGIASDWY